MEIKRGSICRHKYGKGLFVVVRISRRSYIVQNFDPKTYKSGIFIQKETPVKKHKFTKRFIVDPASVVLYGI